MNSPKSKEFDFNQFKSQYSHISSRSFKQTQANVNHKSLTKTASQKLYSTGSLDFSMQKASNLKNEVGNQRKVVKQPDVQKFINFDELIQQKKEALGIKPLDSTQSHYRAVLSEKEKLHRLVEDQK